MGDLCTVHIRMGFILKVFEISLYNAWTLTHSPLILFSCIIIYTPFLFHFHPFDFFPLPKTLHSRFGRSVRKINLPHPSTVPCQHSASACEKLGIELSGSSASGVFVAGIVRRSEAEKGGELQVGDQVLEVNGKSTGRV